MSFQYKIKTDVAAEPVTLDEIKRYLRIDADYASDDEVLGELITSARERLEMFTNIGFAERELELQWNGYPIKLPFSPTGDIESVTKDGEDAPIDVTDYTVKGLVEKEIYVNSVYSGCTFFYPINNGWPLIDTYAEPHALYNVIYKTGYTTDLPVSLLVAIKMEVDYLYKNQGKADLLNISPGAAQKVALYSKNLVIQ